MESYNDEHPDKKKWN